MTADCPPRDPPESVKFRTARRSPTPSGRDECGVAETTTATILSYRSAGMSENPNQPSVPMDVKSIHQLVRLMKRYGMTAIDLIDGDARIRLRRRGPEAAPGFLANPGPHAAQAAPPPQHATMPTAAAVPSTDIVIESPMVGTYYASPTPDSPPFVTVGSTIRAETTVCVIEAMKVFTDIPAGVSGAVTEVLVKNGQPVEFGQPLFRVRHA